MMSRNETVDCTATLQDCLRSGRLSRGHTRRSREGRSEVTTDICATRFHWAAHVHRSAAFEVADLRVPEHDLSDRSRNYLRRLLARIGREAIRDSVL